VPTRLELFDALFGLVFLVLARCVVIGGHASVFSFPILRRWYPPLIGAPIVPEDCPDRTIAGAVVW
jgi:hypothetical protein